MTKFGAGALIALTIFSAGFVGCSQEGNLVIKNHTATEFTGLVDGIRVNIDSGGKYETTVYIGKRLGGVVGPNEFPVMISGSATTKRPFSSELAVYSGRTTTLLLVDDAGALEFTNRYSRSVNKISARPCGGGAFGGNLLDRSIIAPNAVAIIQLDEGCWDLEINYDRDELIDVVAGIEIELGRILAYEWTPLPAPPPPAK